MIPHTVSAHGTTEITAGAAFFAFWAKSARVGGMRRRLERRYDLGHLHFITCSCYRRMPLLDAAKARDRFLKILSEVRERFDFALWGFVVMPEHIHLLISEPAIGDPSAVMKALKQRVSRALRGKKKRLQGSWDSGASRHSSATLIFGRGDSMTSMCGARGSGMRN